MRDRFCPFESSSVMFRAMPDEEEGEVEEEPTHLNTNTCSLYLVVSTDKLTARYMGDGRHGNDVGAIQANRPAPSRRLLYYFEMTVKDSGQKGYTSIGFTDEHFKNSRQPGWEVNTYGYHGDDGKVYHGQGRGEPYGQEFTAGDTVGAGINYAAQEIFFTRNGKVLSGIYKDVKTSLYPTIGLHSPNEKVEVNFGQRKFVFDVETMILEERGRRQRAVENTPLPPAASHSIVRAFLLHYGYHDTLTAFDAACGADGSVDSIEFLPRQDAHGGTSDEYMYALEQRKILRRLITEGNVDGVIDSLQEWYPQVLEDHYSTVIFLLRCQKFIELIRTGQVEDAVTLARTKLASFFGQCRDQDLLLHDCLALLAYERPQESPVAYLLQFAQREVVADAVNAFVLDTNPCMARKDGNPPPPKPALEKLLRQLTACHVEKRFLNGGQGEMFRLHRILQGGKDGGW